MKEMDAIAFMLKEAGKNQLEVEVIRQFASEMFSAGFHFYDDPAYPFEDVVEKACAGALAEWDI